MTAHHLDRPLLKPWYRLARDGDTRLLFEYGHAVVAFEGKAVARLLPALLPLLDGTRTIDEVVRVLGEEVRPAVEQALAVLDGHRLLTAPASSADPGPALETLHWLAGSSELGLDAVQATLQQASVGVAGAGHAAAAIARLLHLSGVGEVVRLESRDELGRAELALVVPAPGELPELEKWNLAALEGEHPWLTVLPFDGRMAVIGPLYVPGETCCYACYGLRRASNLAYGADEFRSLSREPASFPTPPALVEAVAGLAAGLVLGFLVDRNPHLPGVMYALEWGRVPALGKHDVYRVPRCAACSGLADLAPPSPWYAEAVGHAAG